MGKRSADCLGNPSLIEVTHMTSSCHRTTSITSCSSAAMTLLALKQESPSSSLSPSSDDGHGSLESTFLQTKYGQRSPSMCSSVSDDDGSTVEDEGTTGTTCCGDTISVDSPRSGHELLRMALVRPKLRLVSFCTNVSPALSIPTWKVPPEGRPLPPPGRLPSGLVIAPEPSLMTKEV